MQELIAKLEAATEGSRALNIALWAVLKGLDFEWRGEEVFFRVANCHCDEPMPGGRRHAAGIEHWKTFGPGQGGPHYSSSLDAALTLINPEQDVSIGRDPTRVGGCAHAGINSIWFGHAATPALALVIAALKARHAG